MGFKSIEWPSNVPPLTTPRLILREIKATDLVDYYALNSNAQVMDSYGVRTHQSQAETRQLIRLLRQEFKEKRMMRWGIVDKDSKRMIGDIGFWRLVHSRARGEIGMKLLPEFWQRGFITEATQAVYACAFSTLNFQGIEAHVEKSNAASCKLFRRLGMSEVGIFKRHIYSNEADDYIDSICFDINADTWAR